MADRELKIRMLLEAADRFSKPIRELAAGSRKAAAALKVTRTELKDLQRAQAEAASFRKMGGELRATGLQLAEARTKVQQLARAVAAADSPTKRMTGDLAKARRELADLAAQEKLQAAQLDKIRDKMRAAGVETGQIGAHERELASRVQAANERLEQQEKLLGRVGASERRLKAGREAFDKGNARAANVAAGGLASIGTGAAVAAPEIAVVKEAMSFQDIMADIKKVQKFDLEERSVDQLGQKIIALSKVMPRSAEGIGEIVASGARAGIVEDALTAAIKRRHGAQLAAAAADRIRIRTLTEFAEDTTKMGVAFKISDEEAGHTAAAWRTAFNTGREGVIALGDQINALDIKFGGNTAVMSEIVTRVGPLGRVAAATSGELAAMAQMMAKLNIEADRAGTGIKNTLINLSLGTAATPKMRKALATLGLEATNVAKRMQKDAGGTILDVFTRISKLRPDQRVAVLTRLFGREAILAIAPLLSNLDQLKRNFELVGNASEYAGTMQREYNSRTSTTSNELQIADNNFNALKITLGTQLLPTVNKLAGAAGRLAAKIDGFSKSHPVLMRFALLATGAFTGLLIAFGGLAIAAAGVLAPFAALRAVLIVLGTSPLAVIVRFGRALMGLLQILPLVGRAMLLLGSGIARAGILMLANPIVAGIALLVAALAVAGYLIWRHWDTIKGAFWTAIGFLGGIVGRFRQLGGDIMRGLVSGLMSSLGWIKNAIFSIGGRIVDWFKQKLGIHSPSRVFMGLGGYLMQGLDDGIAGGERAPVERVGRLTRQLAEAGKAEPPPQARQRIVQAFKTAPIASPPPIAGQGAPPMVQRMQALSRRVSDAIVLGSATAGMMAAPAAAAPRSPPPAGRASGGPLIGELHVHPSQGMSEQQLADLVVRKIREAERNAQSRQRSSYADDPDRDTYL